MIKLPDPHISEDIRRRLRTYISELELSGSTEEVHESEHGVVVFSDKVSFSVRWWAVLAPRYEVGIKEGDGYRTEYFFDLDDAADFMSEMLRDA